MQCCSLSSRLFLLSTAVLLCIGATNVSSTPVYFSLMVSSAAGQNTSGVVPSVERALQDINNDPNILAAGYSLNYTRVLDTECNSTKALQLFQEELQSSQSILAVIGCGCSAATELVARNSSVPVISYASTSVALNDRSVYRSFFRTVPSDETLPTALSAVFSHHKWRTLAIAAEDAEQFSQLLSLTEVELLRMNITVSNVSVLNEDLDTQISTFLNLQPHIRCLFTSPRLAVSFLCQAYTARRYYPNYLWIVPGWYSENWWMEFSDHLNTLNCTLQQIEQVLNRSLTLSPVPGDIDQATTDISLLNTSSYAADAVRALAMAINESISDNTTEIGNLIDNLRMVSFNGSTGEVQFDENRFLSAALIEQYRFEDGVLTRIPIAFADLMEGNFTFLNLENTTTTWPDGIPPDGIPIKIMTILLLPIEIISIILLISGILLAVGCLIFNLLFRKRLVVKLTSPNLNYLMCLGAVVEISALVFFIVSAPTMDIQLLFSFMCSFSYFLASIGHDISFCLALVKTFRVHLIFRNPSPVRKVLQDWKLFLATCLLVGVDIVLFLALLVPGSITSIPLAVTRDLETPERFNARGVLEIPCSLRCPRNAFFSVWLGSSVLYKFILHLIAIVLACRIRHVEVDAINDYKYNVAIIYISSVLISLLVVVLFVFNSLLNMQNASAASISFLIFMECITFLGLTFFPKMVMLYRDPRGKHIFDKTQSGSGSVTKSLRTQSMTQSMTVINI